MTRPGFGQRTRATASLLERMRTSGAPSGRVLFYKGQPHGAPLSGDIEASFRRLTLRSWRRPRGEQAAQPHPMTAGSHGGGRIVNRGRTVTLTRGHGLPSSRAVSSPRPPRAPRPSSREAVGLQLASSWTRDGGNLTEAGGAGISFVRRALSRHQPASCSAWPRSTVSHHGTVSVQTGSSLQPGTFKCTFDG